MGNDCNQNPEKRTERIVGRHNLKEKLAEHFSELIKNIRFSIKNKLHTK